jgi:hypothetical protein
VATGPVEYIIVGFPGNKFTGEIAPALRDLVERRMIRILDLVFITSDADGNVSTIEVDEHGDLAEFAELDGEVGGIISEDDVEYAALDLEPNSSVALLVWEDTWATPLVEALRGAGGVLLEGARIPADLVESALSGLRSAS